MSAGAVRAGRTTARLRTTRCRGAGKAGPGLAAPDRHHRVHQPQSLERVSGVPDVAVEDRGEIFLDVRPGQRGPAEQHGPAVATPREFISCRFSFMITVDLTSSPDIPMASARFSSAASRIEPIGCLIRG